ncbi:tRNA pseudouridine(55) synthase TruB [Tuwongella immobilis]|uniref:tRNA pseudouridine synthase B n=1 Tax=Tuwongella immobilis TaxID=692036 RepID=A0A6C2YQU6_9BACT|nr:tRNA pseudouridine(55) synthase TruB [Tuwongella immobilis]VIP03856.1 trna pseudouridine synthase b : tRNA pseudouridine synthase B OS=Singulisphaera acidiphila (strain ATCC BAA-1392 / DSM 18658 / VKM B-2454 / MOB10) GN=truB PE=3 SV=1: TruB_N: TruB-C_2 [Tuwongella immobilis]VTS05079.1 trna pseudouridine synthase b : tRNA pseudouridine synthase B OS=Singulisphaera acidiphila (strain ATCC BAA-1392 / DSM 18658 / VKM B-2454 / MOB10) GN=truB PE=3 SV=1: TruB_N: TruB-C_2 [Tuwongella immobilis]
MDGILVLDKPTGMTSRDAVNRVHGQLPRRTKIGHTGTLDPLATGVLVLCLDQATRLVEYVQEMDKVYTATIRLGARSDSDDADGTIALVDDAVMPTREQIEATLAEFHGTIDQTPPAFSAAKVAGKRAYALARRGEEVALAAKPVRIDAILITRFEPPLLEVTVRCGKGTYIRSLARDIGDRLGCGGMIEALRRTAIGPFTEATAIDLDADMTTVRAAVQPMHRILGHLPDMHVTPQQALDLRNGQFLFGLTHQPTGTEFALFQGDEFIGIGRIGEQQELRPFKMFHASPAERVAPGETKID